MARALLYWLYMCCPLPIPEVKRVRSVKFSQAKSTQPTLGRFLNRAYVGNNPVNSTDSVGLGELDLMIDWSHFQSFLQGIVGPGNTVRVVAGKLPVSQRGWQKGCVFNAQLSGTKAVEPWTDPDSGIQYYPMGSTDHDGRRALPNTVVKLGNSLPWLHHRDNPQRPTIDSLRGRVSEQQTQEKLPLNSALHQLTHQITGCSEGFFVEKVTTGILASSTDADQLTRWGQLPDWAQSLIRTNLKNGGY